MVTAAPAVVVLQGSPSTATPPSVGCDIQAQRARCGQASRPWPEGLRLRVWHTAVRDRAPRPAAAHGLWRRVHARVRVRSPLRSRKLV